MGKFSVLEFLHEQWTELPVPTADVTSKSLVVVGANVGLGYEAAVKLAQLKPKSLLITCRDDAKCEQSKAGMNLYIRPRDSNSNLYRYRGPARHSWIQYRIIAS